MQNKKTPKYGPEKKKIKKKKKLKAFKFLLPGAQMALEIFGLFRPLVQNFRRAYLGTYM